MYPEIPALSFISSALTLVPLMWYFQARNIAALAIGMWLSIVNLIHMVDATVWARDTTTDASVWCDISTVLITGSRIALPAACLSNCIHLERLASFCPTSTPQAKRRRIVFECLMCFGLPIVYIALHLIVQPRRFDLFYGFGCRPATYPTVITIFLVMIPPLLLTTLTIIYAGIAWRHFLVHGIQFYGKRGSVSSLTCNLYLRLVGMALLEAVLSAVLIAVVMWGLLSPGLASIENMSRRLSEVLIRGPGEITGNTWTVLQIEWSVTVVQSVVFFGLFACRMEILRQGWELIQLPMRLFKKSGPLGTLGQSLTGTSVPTLPTTVVDLSLVIESAITLAPCDSTNESYPHSLVVEDAPENMMISALSPTMIPPESPSRVPAIASSHNSLESNFDPSQLIFSPDMWPRTPTTIPVRPPRRAFSMRYAPMEESWLEVGLDDVPLPRAKHAVHARPCTADVFGKFAGCGLETQQAGIYVTVVKETH